MGTLEWFVVDAVLAAAVATFAYMKGRSPVLWFLIGFVVWPFVLTRVIKMAPASQSTGGGAVDDDSPRRCPGCFHRIDEGDAECRHCGRVLRG